jgi:hypothetical protein
MSEVRLLRDDEHPRFGMYPPPEPHDLSFKARNLLEISESGNISAHTSAAACFSTTTCHILNRTCFPIRLKLLLRRGPEGKQLEREEYVVPPVAQSRKGNDRFRSIRIQNASIERVFVVQGWQYSEIPGSAFDPSRNPCCDRQQFSLVVRRMPADRASENNQLILRLFPAYALNPFSPLHTGYSTSHENTTDLTTMLD